MKLTRRSFVGSLAAGAGSVALGPLGNSAFAQGDPKRIRHFWWGNPERDKRTFAVIDIFNKKHPDINVTGETLGFADYFTKLATQIAGGNMPDVIQQGYGVLFEYIARGAVVPLDDYVGKSLDISKIDKSAIEAGTVNGKLYGISIGANSHVAMYNTRLFKEAGITFDPFAWTYDDVKRIGVEIGKSTGGKVFGTEDNTNDYQNFSDYVGQMGAEMFAANGDYAVPQEVVESYWALWTDLRKAGATPPGPVSAGLNNAEMSQWGLVTGNTAVSYAWSNQLVGAQKLMKDEIGAAMYPNTPKMIPGSVQQPSQFVCLTRDTVDAVAATTYMSDFVNDPDITGVLGLERGIPANSEVRAALAPALSPAEATSVAFFSGIQGKTMALPPPPPKGANEIEKTFERVAVAILLDQAKISDVAADFLKQAADIRKREG